MFQKVEYIALKIINHSKYLLEKVIGLCDLVLADIYRFHSSGVRRVARRARRCIGDTCAWLRIFPRIPIYTYKVINTYPHDRKAFTQGLVFEDGLLYEGTGIAGQSTLRKVELETGNILQIHQLPSKFFGEGVTVFGNTVFQLTLKSNVGFVYDKASFKLIKTFKYKTEGWGITHNGKSLIMSDGTSALHFLHPETFKEIDRVKVFDNHGPVDRINDLQYIRGEIYANIWLTDRVARIAPKTGRVIGWIDLKVLLSPVERCTPNDCRRGQDALNGIAYDTKGDRLFVTGKLWPRLFEIELVPR